MSDNKKIRECEICTNAALDDSPLCAYCEENEDDYNEYDVDLYLDLDSNDAE